MAGKLFGESSGWGGQDDCLSDKVAGASSLDGVAGAADCTVLVVPVPPLLFVLIWLIFCAIPTLTPPLLDSSPVTAMPASDCCWSSTHDVCRACEGNVSDACVVLGSGSIEAMRIKLLSLQGCNVSGVMRGKEYKRDYGPP